LKEAIIELKMINDKLRVQDQGTTPFPILGKGWGWGTLSTDPDIHPTIGGYFSEKPDAAGREQFHKAVSVQIFGPEALDGEPPVFPD
jgi:hypothetical protein